MSNSEADREFEMTLGNKQLFSVLFIVFVLLGVFFAMGYMMGRNSMPLDPLAAKRSAQAAQEPVERNLPAGDKPSTSTSTSTSTGAAADPERTATPGATQAAPPQQPPADTRTPPPASAEAPPPEPDPSLRGVTEPRPGTVFLQVAAVPKAEAEVLVEVLAKKQFQAIVAPSPNPRLFRVLVGPAKDKDALSALRTELEKSGFKPDLRRY